MRCLGGCIEPAVAVNQIVQIIVAPDVIIPNLSFQGNLHFLKLRRILVGSMAAANTSIPFWSRDGAAATPRQTSEGNA